MNLGFECISLILNYLYLAVMYYYFLAREIFYSGLRSDAFSNIEVSENKNG
jgi:hypothetical protein